jgi:hypothetical protein
MTKAGQETVIRRDREEQRVHIWTAERRAASAAGAGGKNAVSRQER